MENLKDLSRANRRHQTARLKKARKLYWGHGGSSYTTYDTMTPKQLGKVVQYPAVCSCFMCGNARRTDKQLTHQEKKQLQALKDFQKELLSD